MKYFIVMLATVFITVSITLPSRTTSEMQVNDAVDLYNKREAGQTIEIPLKEDKVDLIPYVQDEESERLWGQIGNKVFMVYKDVDYYLFVDGYFHQTTTEWKNGKFQLTEKDFMKLFQVERIKEGVYSIFNQKLSNLCEKEPTEEDILEKMEGMQLPIEGASITQMEGQMPGADRSYRNGFHEGFDWYGGAIGVQIDFDTEITPLYEGKIVRIDKGYKEMDLEERNQLLVDEASMENKKYQKNLDKLRGRQVWVQSQNGVLVRYAHLDSVSTKLNVGDKVTFDDVIGTAGNSGTSNGVLDTEDDIHLHSDILVCGKNFWEWGNVSEMNEKIIEMVEKE